MHQNPFLRHLGSRSHLTTLTPYTIDGSIPLYEYAPIELATQIQLLILQPAISFTDPLETQLLCRDIVYEPLKHTNIDEKTAPYVAVSYCWSILERKTDLLCDSHIIKVTKTVDIMLRYLRKKGRSQRLWIDAICIN